MYEPRFHLLIGFRGVVIAAVSLRSFSRQHHTQFVNLLCTPVAHEYPRAIRSTATPLTKWAGITIKAFQLKNTFGVAVPNFHAANRFLVGDGIVEVEMFAVSRPHRVADCAGRFGQPVRPSLSLVIEEHHLRKIWR